MRRKSSLKRLNVNKVLFYKLVLRATVTAKSVKQIPTCQMAGFFQVRNLIKLEIVANGTSSLSLLA